MDFLDIARKLQLSSNQIDAVYSILCITEGSYIDGKSLKLYAADFPRAFRDWLHVNNPEGIFFAGNSQERYNNNFQDYELIDF